MPRPSKVDPKPLSLFPVHTLWTIDLNADLRSPAPPTFDGVRAFFPIDNDRVVAYDLAAGTRMWITKIAATGPLAASPDLVFVIEARAIDALRVADGSIAWQLPFAGSLAAPLVWDNGWLVAAAIDGTIIAIRATDGYEVWRQTLGSPAHASPTLAADRVYVPTEDGRVVALRVDTGVRVWEHRLGGAASDILALGDRLYVGSKDNSFYCLNAKDGEQAWAVRTGGDVIGMPVADERNVYFLSLDNVLRAVRRNGNQQWKSMLKVRPTAGPIMAADTIIVPALELSLPAFKTSDGTSAGVVLPGGEVATSPHVVTLPAVYGPVVVAVTRDIVKGATVVGQAREIDPPVKPAVTPLPNLITFTPAGTTPTIPKP